MKLKGYTSDALGDEPTKNVKAEKREDGEYNVEGWRMLRVPKNGSYPRSYFHAEAHVSVAPVSPEQIVSGKERATVKISVRLSN